MTCNLNFPLVFSTCKSRSQAACQTRTPVLGTSATAEKKEKPMRKSTVGYSVRALPFGDCQRVPLGWQLISTGLSAGSGRSWLRFATLRTAFVLLSGGCTCPVYPALPPVVILANVINETSIVSSRPPFKKK